jgi:DNA-binding transcriptional regulator GbsR (MarR family)
MTEKEKYIENVGLFYEKYGLPKMAGRILGCLISSETDNNSFENLKGILKASKGSISANVNLLQKQKMIEKHMISGDRKSYYKIALNSLENILDAKVKSVTEFKLIIEKGIKLTSNRDAINQIKLSEIVTYYEFLEKEIPLLKIKWEQKINKK